MGLLRVLGARGHTTIDWEVAKEETVREAERIFRENATKGYASFKLDGAIETAQRTDRLDPEAKQILQIPKIAGG